MEIFDLGIAWDKETDNDFVKCINDYALKEGIRPYLAHAYNFYSTLKDITEDKISFQIFLNRIKDNNSIFSGLTFLLKNKDVVFINHPDKIERVRDKSVMLLDFINQGISVPLAVIINPQDDDKTLALKIKNLTTPFVLKLANGSFREGASQDVHSLDDMQRLKKQCQNITYLAQEKIVPVNLDDRLGRFRVFYCFGKLFPCWWDPVICTYDSLALRDLYRFGLSGLWSITKRVSQICNLDFFSIEIALKNDKKLVVVDYVNDQCDMHRKSKFKDGVPDDVVDKIIETIISFVKQRSRKK